MIKPSKKATVIVVGNVTKVVQTCIASMLDTYFEILASPMTALRIEIAEAKLKKMQIHFIALYQMMNKMAGVRLPEDDNLPPSRKLHAALCGVIPFLKAFGSHKKSDTDSYESIHRLFTVGAWQLTSKRIINMHQEMFKQSVLMNHSVTEEFVEAIASDRVDDYITKRGPYVAPDVVIMKRIGNMKHYVLTVSDDGLLTCDETPLTDLITHSEVDDIYFSNAVRHCLGHENWMKLSNKTLSMTLLQGLSIEGNDDSKAGVNYLYCTESFLSDNLARYDFVYVSLVDLEPQPAMLLTMFEISTEDRSSDDSDDEEENEVCHYYAMIAYLRKSVQTEQPLSSWKCPLTKYQWELHYNNGVLGGSRLIQIVDMSTIIAPAWIVPVFHKTQTPVMGRHHRRTDRFWFLDRKFCDRAGWEDAVPIQDEADNDEDLPDIDEPQLEECNHSSEDEEEYGVSGDCDEERGEEQRPDIDEEEDNYHIYD
jgi:hypothetical protein